MSRHIGQTVTENIQHWTLSVENKRTETIVYVDIARAFDTVSHEKLQIKLPSMRY